MPKESCMLNEDIMEIAMNTLIILLTTLALTIITACGGGGSATTQGSISGTVTKGPMNNATVMAYAISNGQIGAQIATATTDANGSFSMTTGSYAGPVMLQVSGGNYTDEAKGTTMNMAPGDVITAVMPTIMAGATISGIQVTPVTAMAQTIAQHMTGGMSDTNIAAANTAMGTYFTVSDILHIQPMNPLVAGSGAGASQDAKNYGMALAAMSQSALTKNMSSSSSMVTALMNDASDGVMDGMANSTAVQMGGMAGGTPLPATAGTSDLGAAMSAFMTDIAKNKSGITTATLMTKLNGASGQMLIGGPAMVNGTLSGTVFNGPMSKAMVKAFAINNGTMGAQIASVATDGQGNFTMPLGSYSGPVMLQMSGGVYTDEATGTTNMTMGASDVISAVLVANSTNVTGIWVTPVTSMAQTRAQAMSGGMTDASIAAANTAMGNYFSVSDILHV